MLLLMCTILRIDENYRQLRHDFTLPLLCRIDAI